MLVILQGGLPPFQLGFWGSVALSVFWLVLTAFLAVINHRQRSKMEEALGWKNAADSARSELDVLRTSTERLRGERSELLVRIGKLEAATDLKPLIEAIASQQQTIASWIEEGRKRFERAEIGLAENTAGLRSVMEEIRAQRSTSEDSYRALVMSFREHTIQDEQTALELRQVNLRVAACLDTMERRLSELAVRVGHPRWEDPDSVLKTATKPAA